jgi:predicted TIM-barrel fold metal-dependent hydrolase
MVATIRPEVVPETGRLAVISTDCHAGPPAAELATYLDPRYRDRYVEESKPAEAARLEMMSGPRRVTLTGFATRIGLEESAARDATMDAEGVSGEVIFPNAQIPFTPLSLQGVGAHDEGYDLEAHLAGVRAYNSWLADFCALSPGRRAGAGVVPIRDVEASVREVEYLVGAGLRGGIILPPFMNSGFPAYNDPVYEPLWSICEETGTPVNSHGGGRIAAHFGTPEASALVMAETHFFARRALWYLIFSGVFDRHPNLKLVFTEQLADWVPKTLRDLDSIVRNPLGRQVEERLQLKPSEYWTRNCYVGASFMSQPEAEAREQIGIDNLMWGSDYPHYEGTWPYTEQSLRHVFAGVPAEDLRRILSENPARCFGFDLGALRPLADRIGPTVDDLHQPLEALPEGDNLGFAFRTGQWG